MAIMLVQRTHIKSNPELDTGALCVSTWSLVTLHCKRLAVNTLESTVSTKLNLISLVLSLQEVSWLHACLDMFNLDSLAIISTKINYVQSACMTIDQLPSVSNPCHSWVGWGILLALAYLLSTRQHQFNVTFV